MTGSFSEAKCPQKCPQSAPLGLPQPSENSQFQGFPEWPREESNLRARIRSPSLYPLSYGAVRSSVAASTAKSERREGG